MSKGGRRERAQSYGTREGDLFRDQSNPASRVHRVKHEAEGKMFCRLCQAEIVLVQIDSKTWQQRDPDGLPHALTCKG